MMVIVCTSTLMVLRSQNTLPKWYVLATKNAFPTNFWTSELSYYELGEKVSVQSSLLKKPILSSNLYFYVFQRQNQNFHWMKCFTLHTVTCQINKQHQINDWSWNEDLNHTYIIMGVKKSGGIYLSVCIWRSKLMRLKNIGTINEYKNVITHREMLALY